MSPITTEGGWLRDWNEEPSGLSWEKIIWGLHLTWGTSNICSAEFQRWFHPVASFCFALLRPLIKMSTDSNCYPRPPQLHPFQQWMAWVWEDMAYPSGYEQMEMTCTPQRLLHRLFWGAACEHGHGCNSDFGWWCWNELLRILGMCMYMFFKYGGGG